MEIGYSYLSEQFSNPDPILEDIKKLVFSGDFTLGKPMRDFELKFAQICQTKYAIGVGSGTDAIRLSLIALGIKEGDEVITTPNTFFATIGAIVTAGGKPIFVDVDDDYNINPNLIEAAITEKTKAILPVHWSGIPCKMNKIMEISKKYNLKVIEDACHAINGSYQGKAPGTFGITGCFSMHPLKNLNVWGDGGFIVTDSKEMHDQLVLLRNHGLINRDEHLIYGYNSRLDALQAVVANHLLKKIDYILNRAKENKYKIKNAINGLPGIQFRKFNDEDGAQGDTLIFSLETMISPSYLSNFFVNSIQPFSFEVSRSVNIFCTSSRVFKSSVEEVFGDFFKY